MENKKKNSTLIIIGIVITILAILLIGYFALKPKKVSSDNNLKSLKISNYSITFDKDITTYSINIENDITSLEVKAVPMDSNSRVVITGNTNILNDTNEVTITVTAENGASKIYTIHVNKNSNENPEEDNINE